MLNWKNVQYANGSGLVNAIRGNNAQINENNKQVVDSISQFGDDYSKTQTDAAIARLAGSTDPQQAQDILRSYAQGGNGFVDQGLLADSYRDQTQEFRDNAAHADTLLTNKSSRAVNEYKLSPEYQKLEQDKINAQIAGYAAQTAGYDAQLENYKNQAATNRVKNNILKGAFPQYFTDSTNTSVPSNNSQATGDLTSNSNTSINAPSIVNSAKSSLLNNTVPGMGDVKTSENNDSNSTYLVNKYAKTLSGDNTHADTFALKQKMLQELNAGGVSLQNSNQTVNQVFGTFGVTPPKDSESANALDNLASIRDTGNAFTSTGQVGDAINLNESDFVKGFGDVKGKGMYQSMLGTAYTDAVSQAGTLAFNPRNPQNPLSPSVTTSRTNATNYKKFRETIAEYPTNVQESVTARYVAENKINVDEIKTYEDALKSDQSQIKRNISKKLSNNEYDLTDLNGDLQELHGIDINTLTGIHDLAVSQVVKFISTDKDSMSLAETARQMRQETYSEVYTDKEITQATVNIDNFGSRLNSLLDKMLPGSSTNVKKTLLANLKTRFGFEDIQAKLDTRKKTIKATSGYFDSSQFTPFSIGSVQAMISNERGDKDNPYTGNEGAILEETATNFINKALAKAKKEATVIPTDFPNYSEYNLKRVAYKAFSEVFAADDEGLEDDDWIFNSSPLGDDEIETTGVLGNRQIDIEAGTNPKAYSLFIKRYKSLLKSSSSQLKEHIKAKVSQ